jgi:hypothetical protein
MKAEAVPRFLKYAAEQFIKANLQVRAFGCILVDTPVRTFVSGK